MTYISLLVILELNVLNISIVELNAPNTIKSANPRYLSDVIDDITLTQCNLSICWEHKNLFTQYYLWWVYEIIDFMIFFH